MRRMIALLLLLACGLAMSQEVEPTHQGLLNILETWKQGIETGDRAALESIWLYPQAPNLLVYEEGVPLPFDVEQFSAARYIERTLKQEREASIWFTDVKAEVVGDRLGRIHAIWHYAENGTELAQGNDVMSLAWTAEGWKLVSVIWDRKRLEQ